MTSSSFSKAKTAGMAAVVLLTLIAFPLLTSCGPGAGEVGGTETGAGAERGAAAPVKLSVIDNSIAVPSLLATPDGTLHVIFVERHKESPYMEFLYYRASRDGGKSWTAPKNLSEVLPNTPAVGTTRLIADKAGRVYAIWRTLFSGQYAEHSPNSQRDSYNLVYRVLENGAWSNPINIHPPTTQQQQQFGSASWFAADDPSTGRVQVIWNTNPAPRHPELYSYGMVSPGVRLGAVMRVVLDGANRSEPQEFFHTPFVKASGYGGLSCEGLDLLNGYIDAAGQPHFLAQVLQPTVGEQGNQFQLIENNTQYPALDLPGPGYTYWHYPPTLLVDARGGRHVITMYPAGENQSVRDYALGSNAEPQIVRATATSSGQVMAVQAFQGPGGRMAVLMQMADTNPRQDPELYLTTSDGSGWSTPVNLTNNKARTTTTGGGNRPMTISSWTPGDGAVAFDGSGHVNVAFIVNRMDLVGDSTAVLPSTSTPNLLFRRF